jgi:hypothetical protein
MVFWIVIPFEESPTFQRNTLLPSLGLKSKLVTCLLFFACLLFDPEDGNSMFLQNVGLFPIDTFLQPRKPYSS